MSYENHIPVTFDDAMAAVEEFEAMAFFCAVGGAGRSAIAKDLVALVNAKDGEPLWSFGKQIPQTPKERLETFTAAFIRLPGGWPGIGEMEAIYCQMFPPGDGIDRGTPVTAGYTAVDNEAGNHVPLLARAPDPPLLPGPGDESIEDIKAQIEDAAKAKSLSNVRQRR